MGGLQLKLTVAIDFSASNKDRDDPDSLHFADDKDYNEYIYAIDAIGDIICQFDEKKKIPAFGFGAQVDQAVSSEASSCFALNGDIFRPRCDGIAGVLDKYRGAL